MHDRAGQEARAVFADSRREQIYAHFRVRVIAEMRMAEDPYGAYTAGGGDWPGWGRGQAKCGMKTWHEGAGRVYPSAS